MNNRNRIKTISYMALYAATALVLQYVAQFIPFLQMPQGGSIELGFLALFIASFHLGWKNGMAVGIIWWFLGFLFGLNTWYISPIQYALDYILPVLAVGAASVIPMPKKWKIYGDVIIGMLLKFVSNLLAGVFFYFEGAGEGTAAGSLPAWIYSFGYNGWYNLATFIVCLVTVPLLINALSKSGASFKAIQ